MKKFMAGLEYVMAMVICGGLYAASYICRFAAKFVVLSGLFLEKVYGFGVWCYVVGGVVGEELWKAAVRFWEKAGTVMVKMSKESEVGMKKMILAGMDAWSRVKPVLIGWGSYIKEEFLKLVLIREEVLYESGRGSANWVDDLAENDDWI